MDQRQPRSHRRQLPGDPGARWGRTEGWGRSDGWGRPDQWGTPAPGGTPERHSTVDRPDVSDDHSHRDRRHTEGTSGRQHDVGPPGSRSRHRQQAPRRHRRDNGAHRTRTRSTPTSRSMHSLRSGKRRHAGPRPATRSILTAAGVGVVTATCLTLASLSGASSGSAGTTAEATTTGDVVVFGDSYYSAPDDAALTRPCAQSEQNWAALAAADTGRTVHDWSCGGATSGSLLERVKEAQDAGDLNSGVGTVFLSIGGNDFAHQGAVRGMKVDDLEGRREEVLANVSTAVDMIHESAPEARLVFSSYLPSTVGPYVCRSAGPDNGVSAPVYDQDLNEVEAYISDTMSQAAQRHGADFVDVRAAAEGNSTCSPVGQRYIAAEDDGAPDVLMAWHPTQAGVRFMADLFIPEFAG